MEKLRSNNELLAISKDEWESSDCERELAADLLSTRAQLAACQKNLSDLCPIADMPVIESLKAEKLAMMEELAALQDKVRWVPVSERLPEDGKYVLASKGKSVIEAKYYYFAGNLQRHGWYQIDGMFLGVSWAEFWKEKPDAPIPAEGE